VTIQEQRATEPEGTRLEVDGAEIWYRVSGAGEGPPLVLLHGSGANHWWFHDMVPLLEPHHRVVVVDSSGHGESDHREEYTIDGWVEEIAAVVRSLGEPVVLVGHSMGGKFSVLAAARHPEDVAGMVLLDVPLTPPARIRQHAGYPGGPQRYVPTFEELLARFRLSPEQPLPPDDVVRVVVEGSARLTAEGWTWKYDRRGMPPMSDVVLNAAAEQVTCPGVYVYGSESDFMDQGRLDHASAVLPQWPTVVRVDGAHHHLVLEEPERCAAVVHDFAVTLSNHRRS